jgi:hypothetical protein
MASKVLEQAESHGGPVAGIELLWHVGRMGRSSERQLEALQTSYRELLLSALQRCANGQWGLFGHNDAAIDRLGSAMQKRLHHPPVNDLLELGSEIEQLRRKLGYWEPFPLHERLVRMRSSHDANTPGEPKRVQQWLDEMLA